MILSYAAHMTISHEICLRMHEHVPHTAQELVLEVLQALTSDTKIVKESIQKGNLFAA